MSVEIINLFTSSENIKYLHDYLSKNIEIEDAKKIILDSLTESVFDFPSNALLENSKTRLRHSVNTWEEVRLLNQAFINNRIAFSKEFPIVGTEDYASQMFIDDS